MESDDSSEAPRLAQAAVIARELALPLLLILLVSSMLTRWQYALAWINRHRPPYLVAAKTTLLPHVQCQMLNLEVATLDPAPDRVLVVGSSAVVNGVDAARITQRWKAVGVPARLVNFGVTGLMSYELPMIARHLLANRPRAVVFLYNTFSFGDQIHRDAVGTRWNSGEALRSFSLDALRAVGIEGLCDAMLGELSIVLRLRLAFKWVLTDALAGRLTTNDLAFDLVPGSVPRPKIRARVMQPPLLSGDKHYWHRACYLESVTGHDTIGWRGLRRFFELARAAGVPVLVAPAPEPDFAMYGKYKQGVKDEVVDRTATSECRVAGVPCIPRSWCQDLQSDDTLFRDDAHLHDVGRDLLSDRLAELLPRALGLGAK